MEFDVLAQLFDIRVDKVWSVLFNAHSNVQSAFYIYMFSQYSVIEYWYKDYTSKPFVFLLRYYYVYFESMFRLVNHVSGNVCARVT